MVMVWLSTVIVFWQSTYQRHHGRRWGPTFTPLVCLGPPGQQDHVHGPAEAGNLNHINAGIVPLHGPYYKGLFASRFCVDTLVAACYNESAAKGAFCGTPSERILTRNL